MKPIREEEPNRRMSTGERFLFRIVIRTPWSGFGARDTTMMDWLDENCGISDWAIAPASTRGAHNDAIAVYLSNPTCALAFIAHWCLQHDPPGPYEFRIDPAPLGQVDPATPSQTAASRHEVVPSA
jgi:hypothetical protein